MQRMFSLTVVLLGLTAAHAQTGMQLNDQTSSGTGVAADPLSVATSPLPSSQGSALGGGATGPVTGTTNAAGSSASITAPASTNPQAPLQLRGEAPDASTQAAKSATSASGSAAGPAFSGAICGPLVPSTDGGSVNVTELAGGGSLNGC